MDYKISQEGINLIKTFEGCKLTAYKDLAGIWTIGYGHTKKAGAGMTITKEQAEEFLREDLVIFEKAVNNKVTHTITQNQFDALVSFSFNVGNGGFGGSTLLKKLNQGDVAGAAEQFEVWVKAGGKVQPGLVKRRAAEKKLFLMDN